MLKVARILIHHLSWLPASSLTQTKLATFSKTAAMASIIQYRMKNSVKPNEIFSVKFEGPWISLIEFKRMAITQSFGGPNDVDLMVSHEQTGEGLVTSDLRVILGNSGSLFNEFISEITGDQTPIHKNSVIVVARIPLLPGKEIMFAIRYRQIRSFQSFQSPTGLERAKLQPQHQLLFDGPIT